MFFWIRGVLCCRQRKPKKMHQQKARPISEPVLCFFCFLFARLLVVANSFMNLVLGSSWALQREGEVSLKDFCLNIVCLELSCSREYLRIWVSAQNVHLPALPLPLHSCPWTFFIYFFRSNESVSQYGSYLAEPRLMAGCSLRTNENAWT